MSDKMRLLAQYIADGQIESAEYLDAVEIADAEELDLTLGEIREAHSLALRAKAVLPDA